MPAKVSVSSATRKSAEAHNAPDISDDLRTVTELLDLLRDIRRRAELRADELMREQATSGAAPTAKGGMAVE
jgi:hypothetical protein